MRTISKMICTVLLGMLVTAGSASIGMAQRQPGYSDPTLRDLFSRIATRTEDFRRTAQSAMDRSDLNNSSRDQLSSLIEDFSAATIQLSRRTGSRQPTRSEVRVVLDRAALINNFLLNSQLGYGAQRDWNLLRGDLDQLARAYNLNWNWNSTSSSGDNGNFDSAMGNAQMRQLIQRVDNRTTIFSRSFRQELNRSSSDRYSLDEARRQLSAFESAVVQLRNRFNNQQQNATDVRSALEKGAFLDRYLADHRLSYQTQNTWNQLRQDLDRLAGAYNIAWNWSTRPVPDGPVYRTTARLTGTYRLNNSQGDDVSRAAGDATRSLPATDRQRVYDSLVRRLDPPNALAIDQSGNNVTIASNRAPQINFVADGQEHVETTPNGRSVRVRASLSRGQLSIARTGDRAQDFTVTFEPIENGRRLLVTRRLYTDQLNQPVTVRTYYDKTSDVAQLSIYETNPESADAGTATGDFVVPNGTRLVAMLSSNLSTQNTRVNDRFTMTVRSPSQYDGATIEGYVTNINRGGRVTGRSDMTLNFDTIRLRDGRTYRFAGIVDGVRTSDGQTVRIDNEGAVREEDSQTNRTVTRTAIGSAVGAIIGAIAGGGKGAAIGAAIGAGAGAGSVYVQGPNDLELNAGTEVMIRASRPR